MAVLRTNVIPRAVNFLRLIWMLVMLWYELGTFYSHTASCLWPDDALTSASAPSLSPTHVLLVADPQILDHRSYPDRPPWLMRLSQFIVDLNIRKSWRAVRRRRPDSVVFVGDMMDSGRVDMSDEEYGRYIRRFRSIFNHDQQTPMHYIAGNHDIGLGGSLRFSDHARERYLSSFDPLNQRITLGNHTALLIDAPSLVDEDRERAAAGASYGEWASIHPDRTIAFVHMFARDVDPAETDARILFTHVPLSRPEGASCGPLRERGTIHQGRGLGYQNLLTPQASQFLLQSIRPAIVFSGDDHDYCEYVHTLPATDTKRPSPPTSIPEITIKSFSMAMGVRRPGYQLLSLIPPFSSSDSPTFAHTPCLLPDQLGIYLSIYVPLIVASLTVLLFSNVRRSCTRNSSPSPRQSEWTSLDARDPDGPEADYDLPPPSAWRSKEFPRAGWSRTYVFTTCGRRRRLTVSRGALLGPLVAFFWTGRKGVEDSQRRRGVLKGFVVDVRDVAWLPLALFVGIAWWVW
ncbi:Metallo-dependent phosphatase-like protein [Lenzites betulinus]|nr:Metallo-dependent phosphatase-like protein [Lenzites betulinus]